MVIHHKGQVGKRIIFVIWVNRAFNSVFEIKFFSLAPEPLLRLEFIMILRAAWRCARGATESTKHYENNNDLTFTLVSSLPRLLMAGVSVDGSH